MTPFPHSTEFYPRYVHMNFSYNFFFLAEIIRLLLIRQPEKSLCQNIVINHNFSAEHKFLYGYVSDV